MDPDVAARVRRESFVRWVGPYAAHLRLAPELSASLADPYFEPSRFILQTFAPGADEKSSLAADVIAVGGSVILQTPNGYLIEALLNGPQALEILDSDNLQWMELWTPAEDDMDIGRIVSGADDIETLGGYDGTGVRGEVMDGNVEQGHQDFDGILIHGPAPSGRRLPRHQHLRHRLRQRRPRWRRQPSGHRNAARGAGLFCGLQ